jgi:hypothetical protein
MIVIGLDISMRSSALVARTKTEVLDFKVITSKKEEYDNESLLAYNIDQVLTFLHQFKKDEPDIVMEGLSLRSVAGTLDRIVGNHWAIRTAIWSVFGFAPKIVAPASWRKHILTRVDLDELLEMRRAKMPSAKTKKKTKEICCDKIDKDLIYRYNSYIKTEKLSKDAIYDLSDAYHIAGYGLL